MSVKNSLKCISPIDGRYEKKTIDLAEFYSEFALIRTRVEVEVCYFCHLTEILPQLAPIQQHPFIQQDIHRLYTEFTLEDAEQIKRFEDITNHDVKAVEYFLKKKFEEVGLGEYKEFIHFGLTSEDIDSTTRTTNFSRSISDCMIPSIDGLAVNLQEKCALWIGVPMLARTHGQPASTTILGKELSVFLERLRVQLTILNGIKLSAKFGGATGNFNAHHVAYPEIDWIAFANKFLNQFGLSRDYPTTQIQHFDSMAEMLDTLKRIAGILLDLSVDVWLYISRDYFKQKIKAGEVGSSAMPHKVNPLDFENAEGNLKIAIAFFNVISIEIQRSREQRDLSISTILRNLGMPMSYLMIAIDSLCKGINKLILNEDKINSEIGDHCEVISEAIQTILRREMYPAPYEALKELTRVNQKVTKESLHTFIDGLHVSDEIKAEMKLITPFNYTGISYMLFD